MTLRKLLLRRKVRAQYLIVDGHSVIFAWPELRALHRRRTSLARDALVKKLRDYQDWTGVRVAVVFDGKGIGRQREFRAGGDPNFLFARGSNGGLHH